MTPPEFTRAKNEFFILGGQLDYARGAQNLITSGSPLPASQKEYVDGLVNAMIKAQQAAGIQVNLADVSPIAAVRSHIDALNKQQEIALRQAWDADPDAAMSTPGLGSLENLNNYADAMKKLSAGGAADRVKYTVQIAPGTGRAYRVGDDGSITPGEVYPDLINKTTQVVTDQRSGKAYALTLDPNGTVTGKTDLGQFAFPEVDPERKFRLDVMSRAVEAETAFAGIALQRRGQVLGALAEDMRNQITLGQMTYQEAQVNLNRVEAAFEARRKEREIILRFAVSAASLRRNESGELVTRLPLAGQLAAGMTAATGRQFAPDAFDLPVMGVNPDQAAQGIMDASAFTSPLPGLYDQMQQTRNSVNEIVGQPVGNSAASSMFAELATGGA